MIGFFSGIMDSYGWVRFVADFGGRPGCPGAQGCPGARVPRCPGARVLRWSGAWVPGSIIAL
eukprot:5700937-Pyramimonas_sp.AAC.1